MNIAEAKKVPIELIAEKLGAVRFKENAHDIIYYSPFRDEKTPSFHVRKKLNKYKDHGDHRGQGDGPDLVCDYNNKDRKDPQAIREALAFIQDLGSMPYVIREVKMSQAESQPSKRYKILNSYEVNPRSRKFPDNLMWELERRDVDFKIVKNRLKHSHIVDYGEKVDGKFNTFHAFSFKNNLGYDEVSRPIPEENRTQKLCIGHKAIKTYNALPETKLIRASLFTGIWDEITKINEKGKKQDELHIVTTSDSLLKAGVEFLSQRKEQIIKLGAYMDHDSSRAGELAGHRLALMLTEVGFPDELIYEPMDWQYEGFKDYSDKRIKTKERALSLAESAPSKKAEIKYSGSDAGDVLRDRSPYNSKPGY